MTWHLVFTPPPKGGLTTLLTTLPPLVGSSAREVSDLAVSLNVVGVEVGSKGGFQVCSEDRGSGSHAQLWTPFSL